METSILIGKIMGPIFMIIAAGVLLNRSYYEKMFEELAVNRAGFYLSGVSALLLGSLLVRFHNVWVFDWPVIITVIGWISVLKGITIVMAPRFMVDFSRAYVENKALITSALFANVALGALLTYGAYTA